MNIDIDIYFKNIFLLFLQNKVIIFLKYILKIINI